MRQIIMPLGSCVGDDDDDDDLDDACLLLAHHILIPFIYTHIDTNNKSLLDGWCKSQQTEVSVCKCAGEGLHA